VTQGAAEGRVDRRRHACSGGETDGKSRGLDGKMWEGTMEKENDTSRNHYP